MDPETQQPTLRAPGFGRAAEPASPPIGPAERLVEPETSREEMLDGRRIHAAPAEHQHADPHCRLDYLLSAHARPGYVASSDLLTRVAGDSDFASDTCVRRNGTDPATGQRYLEELAFEVVHRRKRKDNERRAALMLRRGVRRVFGVFVLRETVAEYDSGEGRWRELPRTTSIEDPCLVRPLPVLALLDVAAADAAVVAALDARGEAALQQLRQASEAEGARRGEALGRREGEAAGRRNGEAAGRRKGAVDLLRRILEQRFGPLPVAVLQRLDDADYQEIEGWTTHVLDAASLSDLFDR